MGAAIGGYVEIASVLLAAKADVNAKGCYFNLAVRPHSALGISSREGHVELVRLLSSHRALLDDPVTGAWDMRIASYSGHAGAVAALIGMKASVDAEDAFNKRTPLIHAVRHGYLHVVGVLLGARANVELADNWNCTALDYCKRNDKNYDPVQLEEVQKMLELAGGKSRSFQNLLSLHDGVGDRS